MLTLLFYTIQISARQRIISQIQVIAFIKDLDSFKDKSTFSFNLIQNFLPSCYRLFRIRRIKLTSTAKQVLGNCERMVFASFIGNFNFDSFNPNFLFSCAVNFYLIILVVNLYIVLARFMKGYQIKKNY